MSTAAPALVKGKLVNPNTLSLTIAVSALAVVINVLGGTFVGLLGIPFLFLDAIGTFFIAALFGVRWGILVGIVTNLVLGLTTHPTTIPFGLVQVAIAVIVGLLANRWGYTWYIAAISGVIVAIVAPIIGTAIAVGLFGGLTGGGLDLVTLWLVQSGQNIFGAAFFPRLGSNAIDKVLTAFLVYGILKAIPTTLVKRRRRAVEAPAAEAVEPELADAK